MSLQIQSWCSENPTINCLSSIKSNLCTAELLQQMFAASRRRVVNKPSTRNWTIRVVVVVLVVFIQDQKVCCQLSKSFAINWWMRQMPAPVQSIYLENWEYSKKIHISKRYYHTDCTSVIFLRCLKPRSKDSRLHEINEVIKAPKA